VSGRKKEGGALKVVGRRLGGDVRNGGETTARGYMPRGYWNGQEFNLEKWPGYLNAQGVLSLCGEGVRVYLYGQGPDV
jgi:hypothetical protein